MISTSELMTIRHQVMKHLWRELRKMVPWGRVHQAASNHVYCTLFFSFIKVLFPFLRHVRFSSNTDRLVIECFVSHAT
jgi:hypothetical protein